MGARLRKGCDRLSARNSSITRAARDCESGESLGRKWGRVAAVTGSVRVAREWRAESATFRPSSQLVGTTGPRTRKGRRLSASAFHITPWSRDFETGVSSCRDRIGTGDCGVMASQQHATQKVDPNRLITDWAGRGRVLRFERLRSGRSGTFPRAAGSPAQRLKTHDRIVKERLAGRILVRLTGEPQDRGQACRICYSNRSWRLASSPCAVPRAGRPASGPPRPSRAEPPSRDTAGRTPDTAAVVRDRAPPGPASPGSWPDRANRADRC